MPGAKAPLGLENEAAKSITVSPEEVRLTLEAGQQEAVIQLTITNTSGAAIKVLGVQSDCGCVLATQTEATLDPKATTLLGATFRPTPGMGGQTVTKKLQVTHTGADSPTTVELVAEVAATRTVSADKLSWKANLLAPLEVTLASPLEFELNNVNCSHAAGFRWEVLDRPDSKSVKVKVWPLSRQKRNSMLMLQTTLPVPWSQMAVGLTVSE